MPAIPRPGRCVPSPPRRTEVLFCVESCKARVLRPEVNHSNLRCERAGESCMNPGRMATSDNDRTRYPLLADAARITWGHHFRMERKSTTCPLEVMLKSADYDRRQGVQPIKLFGRTNSPRWFIPQRLQDLLFLPDQCAIFVC